MGIILGYTLKHHPMAKTIQIHLKRTEKKLVINLSVKITPYL